MRVIVCGGRHYRHHLKVDLALDAFHAQTPISYLMEGGATGADAFARLWRERRGIPGKTYKADWEDIRAPGAVIRTTYHGRSYNLLAGHWRNQQMIDDGNPDVVIAFPGGDGTKNMIERAQVAHIPVEYGEEWLKPRS